MAGAQPAIDLPTPPGGHIYAGEAGLSIGSNPGGVSTGGAWTFGISAADGVRDLTVGGLVAIRDGVFTAGSLDLGYGTLSVTGYDADVVPEKFRHNPRVEKPMRPADLLAAVEALG